jgi:two-component system nitrogen regulation response regulator GlnG
VFLAEIGELSPPETIRITRETLDLLTAYAWPGNVRELKNVIQSMIARTRISGPTLTPDTLPEWIRRFEDIRLDEPPTENDLAGIDAASITLDVMETHADRARRRLFAFVYRRLRGNRKRIAAQLGMSRNTLYKTPWKLWLDALDHPDQDSGK